MMTIAEPTSANEDAPREYLKAYATDRAAKAWLALHPPVGATGRQKAVLMLVGFSDADEVTAGYLLDRCAAATDEALADDQRRDAICSMLTKSVATVSYSEH